MRNITLANALRAAAAVLEADGEGEAVTYAAAAPAVPSLADKVRDFLSNDTSGYDWRSASAIATAIGATASEVETAVRGSSELQAKQSQRSGMGVLIALRD